MLLFHPFLDYYLLSTRSLLCLKSLRITQLTWKLEVTVDPLFERALTDGIEKGIGVREVTEPDQFDHHRLKPGHMKSNDRIETLRRDYTARSMWWSVTLFSSF
jgi:hypothetical protein